MFYACQRHSSEFLNKMSKQNEFHVVTPLLESTGMSKRMGSTVYLKMENSQPTGSFKIRGIGHMCQNVRRNTFCLVLQIRKSREVLFVLQVVMLGWPQHMRRESSTCQPPLFYLQQLLSLLLRNLWTKEQQSKLRARHEHSIITLAWDEANAEALRLAEIEGLTVIHPFNHPLVWKGHSTIVHELKASLPSKPGAIVLSVGGGGLFCGVMEGLDEVGWGDVPVLCMECVGADCLNVALKARNLVTLADITSEATCLGAKTACPQAFEFAKRPNVISEVVSDQQALEAMEHFLDEERVLVELACGASLAAVYSGVIQRLQDEGRLPKPLEPLVMIVCGGGSVNLAQLQHLQRVIRK
ncbi:hypothetical protein DNTS_027320 [Danionella cerebrum]|uniref:L-serine ammonia-lyase n=1 Tax=Danionella cerebrum TaxID=2873325 RepID=A0A553QVT3_9TELE|nr:hypothetical protein DNTS_027320 [Danionella translucida]